MRHTFRGRSVCACLLAIAGLLPAGAARRSPFLQVSTATTWTDNVFLHPQAQDDLMTTLSIQYRQPLAEHAKTQVRFKADATAFHWARGSFDDTLHALLGVEVRHRPDRGHEFRWGIQHTVNDAYDTQAPFHTFDANELTAGYAFPNGRRSTTELTYLVSRRTWDSAVRGRDGIAQSFGVAATASLDRCTDVRLFARHEVVDTRAQTDVFTREWLGGSITRDLARTARAPRLSLDYRYYVREYSGTTRLDHKHACDLDIAWPLGPDTSLELQYGTARNDSTHAGNRYRARKLAVSAVRRF